MRFSAGDIVIGRFPFADDGRSKFRPVLVLARSDSYSDYLVMFVSSQPAPNPADEFLLSQRHPAFSHTGLKRSSSFRLLKLGTISGPLLQRRLASLPAEIHHHVLNLLISQLQSQSKGVSS